MVHRPSPLTGPGSDIDHVVPDGSDVHAFVDETEVAYCWLCSLDQFGKIGSGALFPAHRVSCCNDCFHEFRVRCGNNGVCFFEVAVRVPFTNRISMISSIQFQKQDCRIWIFPETVGLRIIQCTMVGDGHM